jgi:hypothetical protein
MVYASTIETDETGIHIVNDGAVFLMGSVMEIVLNVPGLALNLANALVSAFIFLGW